MNWANGTKCLDTGPISGPDEGKIGLFPWWDGNPGGLLWFCIWHHKKILSPDLFLTCGSPGILSLQHCKNPTSTGNIWCWTRKVRRSGLWWELTQSVVICYGSSSKLIHALWGNSLFNIEDSFLWEVFVGYVDWLGSWLQHGQREGETWEYNYWLRTWSQGMLWKSLISPDNLCWT